jgi:hypothetical protein
MTAGAEYFGDYLTQALFSKLFLIAKYLIACNEARTVKQTSVKW